MSNILALHLEISIITKFLVVYLSQSTGITLPLPVQFYLLINILLMRKHLYLNFVFV
jgi:hypothetical protein